MSQSSLNTQLPHFCNKLWCVGRHWEACQALLQLLLHLVLKSTIGCLSHFQEITCSRNHCKHWGFFRVLWASIDPLWSVVVDSLPARIAKQDQEQAHKQLKQYRIINK